MAAHIAPRTRLRTLASTLGGGSVVLIFWALLALSLRAGGGA